MSLLSLEGAHERLLALAPRMEGEQVNVEAALGRVLAADLLARRTQPLADLSAMDGYAIAGDGPWRLTGESRAGAPFSQVLQAGEAARISTGAHMPDGADRVLIQENAQVDGGQLEAREMPAPGRHVRRRGFDFAEGGRVLERGTRIGPAQLALALAAGHSAVQVARQPRVAVLDSGDELAADPANCGPNQIPASNGAMIAAMLSPLVGCCERLGPVPDDRTALAKALERADGVDILVTSGGASVGDHDLVQQALTDWGAQIAFWKVAIKPGKPLMVATRDGAAGPQVVLGLPGNPVSSFVTAFLFALPLVRAAMGIPRPLPLSTRSKALASLPATGSRREFVRADATGEGVVPVASQDSSALRALGMSNCLIDRPANAPSVSAGELVDVHSLRNG